MSDSEIILVGIVVSFAIAAVLWYLVEDEIERLWHERKMRGRK